MNPSENNAQSSSPECCGKGGGVPGAGSASAHPWFARTVLWGILLLTGWFAVYQNLAAVSRWLTYDLLGLTPGLHLSAAVEFFVFEVPKVLLLLVLIVFFVGIARSFFTPERTRRILSGKREFVGNILAALLGVVTPFCSCSAVPLFIGFVTTGVPLGVTFSFLISAPMVNEIALVLLFGLFGWKVAAIYLGTGLLIALVAGWVIGRLRMERYVEEWVFAMQNGPMVEDAPLTWPERIAQGWEAVRDIVGRVWFYVMLGIAVGAAIHGYVPEGLMASVMGKGAWWSVPVAVLMGVPMYSNAGDHPRGAGFAGQRGGVGDRAGLHDVGHRPLAAGSGDPAQGS